MCEFRAMETLNGRRKGTKCEVVYKIVMLSAKLCMLGLNTGLSLGLKLAQNLERANEVIFRESVYFVEHSANLNAKCEFQCH